MPTSLENTIRGIQQPQTQTQENLLNQVPVEKILRPKGFYKRIGLDVLTVLSAVWVGYSCHNFLANGAVLNFAISIFPFLTLTSFEAVLTKSFGRRFFILILETLALLMFFLANPMTYLAIAGGIFLVFSVIGELGSRSEVMNSLEINFLKFTAPVFKKTITGLILLTLILYIPLWQYKDAFISQRTFGGVFVWTTGFIGNFYPEINFNSTINDLSKEITKYQLTGTQVYQSLPTAAAQKTIIDQLDAQNNAKLKEFFGSNLSGDERLSDIIYKMILDSLNNWKAQFGIWFIISWVAVVFLAARTIGAVVWWVSAFISLLLYQLLVALNFLAIRGEAVTKESLVFP